MTRLRWVGLPIVALAIALALFVGQPAETAFAAPYGQLQGHDTQNLRWLKANHPKLYSQIVALPWVADGLSNPERKNLDWMLYIGVRDIPTLASLIPMPFLSTADSTDVLALRAIHRLAVEGQLDPLTEHESFLDGIDDNETTLVAAAGTVYRHPEEISNMLTPNYVSIETMTDEEGMRLSIVRPSTASPSVESMGALKDAVDFVETAMEIPLPTDHVILVLHDKAFRTSAAGANHGFAISYKPSNEQPEDIWFWWHFRTGLAHEVAHYFWRDSEDWIDEGLATTFEYLFGLNIGLSPGQLRQQRDDCEAPDLKALSENPPVRGEPQFICNYYLGSRLFDDLRGAMDQMEFRGAMQDLYALTVTEQAARREPGIDEVRQAFSTQAAIVEKHWSGRLNSRENRPFDEGVERTSHDLIQWVAHPTYDRESNTVTFGGALLEDAVLTNAILGSGGYQNFTLSPSGAAGYLGSILPPLSSGRNWILDDPGDTVASGYSLSGREFSVTFPFPIDGSPEDFVVIVWGFRDAQRIPSISDDVDLLGYARIREPPITGSVVGDRYDANNNGVIGKSEVIAAINDYLFGTGDDVPTKADVIELINLYLFG